MAEELHHPSADRPRFSDVTLAKWKHGGTRDWVVPMENSAGYVQGSGRDPNTTPKLLNSAGKG